MQCVLRAVEVLWTPHLHCMHSYSFSVVDQFVNTPIDRLSTPAETHVNKVVNKMWGHNQIFSKDHKFCLHSARNATDLT